jgi:2,3-bisphosphoglycerate-dependent phosphoglycerate mutase
MTTLYLVRHAHADWTGSEDRPLSEAGAAAARTLAASLASYPIAAIYSSPFRRSVDTVTPLSKRIGIPLALHDDLRERELPIVSLDNFEPLVREAWSKPDIPPGGGESNHAAQTRGLAAVQLIARRHEGEHIVVGTHGNLLTLILHGMDSTYDFEFWRRLSLPDVYRVELERAAMKHITRLWDITR